MVGGLEVKVQAHVLVVGDDTTKGLWVAGELLRHAFRVTVCTTAERALARIAEGDVDVVLETHAIRSVEETLEAVREALAA